MKKSDVKNIEPQAFSKKENNLWCIYKNKQSVLPVCKDSNIYDAWHEAYFLLQEKYIKVPTNWTYVKKNEEGQWYIDTFDSWEYVVKSEYSTLSETEYTIDFEQSSASTFKNRWFWSAFATSEKSLYHKITTNNAFMLKIDCIMEAKEVMTCLGIKNLYEKQMSLTRIPLV